MTTQADIDRREKEKQNERELEHIAATHVCAECGGQLVTPWDPEQNQIVLRCGTNKTHAGFRKVESYTALWRRGELADPYIKNILDQKYRRQHMTQDPGTQVSTTTPGALSVEKPSVLALIVSERWPDLEGKAVMLFCYHCIRMGLDPLLGEIVPTVFRVGADKKQVLVPIITEMGVGSLAARACKEAWNGPPSVELVTDPELREAVSGDPDAIVWKAKGRRKDWEEGRLYETYGWITRSQMAEAVEKKKPSGELPGNQARVRAIKRWIMEAYPEAASKVRGMASQVKAESEGANEALDAIEAEYTVVGGATKQLHPPTPYGVCALHHVQLVKGQYGIYCPRKVKNDKGAMVFCKGVKETREAATAQPPLMDNQAPAPEEEPK